MTRGVVATLGALALVSYIGLQPAFADQAQNPSSAPGAQAPAPAPAPAAQAQAPKSESAKGELQSVDTAKKTLTIAEGGSPQVFQYTDSTKVTGAKGIEGLGTMSGRQVTVQFTTKGADRIATSVEVAAK
jgi:hypothetical protein